MILIILHTVNQNMVHALSPSHLFSLTHTYKHTGTTELVLIASKLFYHIKKYATNIFLYKMTMCLLNTLSFFNHSFYLRYFLGFV